DQVSCCDVVSWIGRVAEGLKFSSHASVGRGARAAPVAGGAAFWLRRRSPGLPSAPLLAGDSAAYGYCGGEWEPFGHSHSSRAAEGRFNAGRGGAGPLVGGVLRRAIPADLPCAPSGR